MKDIKIPSIYKPVNIPNTENIADALFIDSLPTEIIASTIDNTIAKEVAAISLEKKLNNFMTVSGAPEPLTELEAEVFTDRFNVVKARIDNFLGVIESSKEQITNQIASSNGIVFHLEIERKRRVKKALTRLLGTDSPDISYETYLALLDARTKLELEGMKDYQSGFDEEDE